MENDFLEISIVLPLYNVEKYLERCLLSLKRQTYENFEAIFVDDGSSDKSLEIIQEYAKNDSRIQIVCHSKNLGTFEARKTGVIKASGDYIVFLDPDDELSFETLEVLVENIDENPDIIFFDIQINPKPKIFSSLPDELILKKDVGWSENCLRILKCKNLNKGTAGKAYNAMFFKKIYESFEIDTKEKIIFGEDKLLFLAALLLAKSALSIHGATYIYHKNITSITNVSSDDVVFNKIRQLTLVRKHMCVLLSNSNNSLKEIIKDKILIKDIDLDILKEKNKQNSSFFTTIYLYKEIFMKTKSCKDFLKQFFYILSLGFIKF